MNKNEFDYDVDKILNEESKLIDRYKLISPKEEDNTDSEIIEGIITNILDFGAFVDIGNHQSGLVHISEISEKFITDIHKELKIGERVKVKILNKEEDKISLTMKI